MTDCAFSLNGMAGAGYLAAGVEPEMEALALNGGSFYDYYRTRDGRWFSVGSLEPQFMQQFCAAIGRPELAARGLSPKPEEQRALKREIEMEFEKRDFAEWQAVFADLDACVEPMLPLSEALEHPQLQARGLVARCRWRTAAARRRWPVRSSSPPACRRLATSARRSVPIPWRCSKAWATPPSGSPS